MITQLNIDFSTLQSDTSLVVNYDPTRTTMLRNAFIVELSKRFNELSKAIMTSVDTNDCFGLNPGVYQVNPVGRKAFNFPTNAEKVREFNAWLASQVDHGLLEVGEVGQIGIQAENAWTNRYILDSYKRGVQRARYELDKAGFVVPNIEATGGIEISMSTLLHVDSLGLLYTRTFNDLKGITQNMSTQISRVLAQGLADGDGAKLLARKLVSTINGKNAGDLGLTDTLGRFIPAKRRAETLARTEIIRAHHTATINEYRQWGVEGVTVKAEFVTAGDTRVCEECLALERQGIFTLDEASGLIPVHPGCRCIVLPYRETDERIKK